MRTVDGQLLVVDAGQQIKMSHNSPSGEVLVIYLSVPKQFLSELPFAQIRREEIFDAKKLVLSSNEPVQAIVSVAKSPMYDKAALTAPTKMYLVEGDRVNILKYSVGWIKVMFKSPKGLEIIKWIAMSDVL